MFGPAVCCNAEAPLEHGDSRCRRVHRAGTGTGGRCPRRVPTPASWAQMDKHVQGEGVGALTFCRTVGELLGGMRSSTFYFILYPVPVPLRDGKK